jgi:hypothetical protein
VATLTKTADLAFTNFAYGWSPDQRPQDGDTLIANTGTVVQIAERLPNTTLDLGFSFDPTTSSYLPPPVFDMIGGTIGSVDVTTQTPAPGGAQINIFGHATIDSLALGATFAGDKATVNLAPHSRLTATFDGGSRSQLQVNGNPGAVLDNEGDSTVSIAHIVANVAGSGTWHDGGFGHMEFAGSVSRGQTIDLSGNAGLTIDHPDNFHAGIMLENGWGPGIGAPNILLAGVQGDSWTYRNDMLTIRSGGQVVDHLRISEAAGEAFQVTGSAAGTVLSGNFGSSAFFSQQASGIIAPATS